LASFIKILKRIFTKFEFPDEMSFMCDGAKYIRSAAKKTFPFATVELCNFHFWQTQENKLKNKTLVPNLKNEEIPQKFLPYFKSSNSKKNSNNFSISEVLRFDIKILQNLPNKKLFLNYVQIMKPFWKGYAPNYWNYFFENYIDATKSDCYTGWQNCYRKTGPRTNNSLEAFNRIIKEVMTDYKKLPFNSFVESVLEELTRRSEESASLFHFPKMPLIPGPLLVLAQFLSTNFESCFEEFEENYFIKDRFISCSIYNTATGKIKQKISQLSSKIKNEDSSSKEKFLAFYQKPSIRSIQSFLEANSKVRTHFLSIAPIRILKLNIVEDNEDLTL